MSNGSAIAASEPPPGDDRGGLPGGLPGRLEAMFRAHNGVVWRTLRRRGLDPDAAADATQQCFLVAAERINDIRADRERAFLIGIALNVALTSFRSASRWQLGDDLDLQPTSSHGGPGEDQMDRRRTLELLDRAMARLDADLLEVFVLFEIEGMTSPEIAALIGIPLGTVASRLRRARESFREAVTRMERVMRREVSR
jgi:RNA polymerase sigma-70 factor, ECF subfamily